MTIKYYKYQSAEGSAVYVQCRRNGIWRNECRLLYKL